MRPNNISNEKKIEFRVEKFEFRVKNFEFRVEKFELKRLVSSHFVFSLVVRLQLIDQFCITTFLVRTFPPASCGFLIPLLLRFFPKRNCPLLDEKTDR